MNEHGSAHSMTSVTLLHALSDSIDQIWSCAWSSNGKLLATAGADRKIRLYSSDSFSLLSSLPTSHQKSIRNLSFCPHRKQIAAASFDGSVSIWSDQRGWACTATVEGHENEVKAAVWASFVDESEGEEQRFLATCGRDKAVWIWAVEESLQDPQDEDYECLAVMQEHEQDIKCMAWHPQIPLLLTGSYDESVRVWGPTNPSLDDWIARGELCKRLGGTVWSLAFNASGSKLAVALSTGKLLIFTLPQEWDSFKEWQKQEFTLFHAIPLPQNEGCSKADGEGCCKNSNRGGCGSDSKTKESGCCSDSKAEEYTYCNDSKAEESSCCNDSHSKESGCCNDSGSNANESTCCNDDSTANANTDDSGCCGSSSNANSNNSGCCGSSKASKQNFSIPPTELFSLSWSPSGKLLALASGARSILLFDVIKGEVVCALENAHEEDINCVSWSPISEDCFVSASDDGSVKVWRVEL